MDADEFVSIKCSDGFLSDVMERLPDDADALAITWRFFGSNGLIDWNPCLVTESYLIEWIAYHRRLGFDNICVYTNNCSEGTDDLLIRLAEIGLCRHFRNDVPQGDRPQMNALGLASRNPQVTETDLVLVMDADEFLSIKCGQGHMSDLVAAMEPNAVAMAITWRFFGSSEITSWNPRLVTESYTQAAPDGFRKGWGVKTMFRPY